MIFILVLLCKMSSTCNKCIGRHRSRIIKAYKDKYRRYTVIQFHAIKAEVFEYNNYFDDYVSDLLDTEPVHMLSWNPLTETVFYAIGMSDSYLLYLTDKYSDNSYLDYSSYGCRCHLNRRRNHSILIRYTPSTVPGYECQIRCRLKLSAECTRSN